VDAGETAAQAAAREAGEEAGVVGVVSGMRLTRYRHAPSRRAGHANDLVDAFLLEVASVGSSSEEGREPTWFDFATASEMLAEGRDVFHAQEVQRVLGTAQRELRGR